MTVIAGKVFLENIKSVGVWGFESQVLQEKKKECGICIN